MTVVSILFFLASFLMIQTLIKGQDSPGFRAFRKRIYEIIEASKKGDTVSKIYDIFMLIVIVMSLVPLCLKKVPFFLRPMELICTLIFCADYLLRWFTADFKLPDKKWPFLWYPFTLFAIMDFLSLIPTLLQINVDARLLIPWFDTLRVLRVSRTFKVFRYSKQFKMITSVVHRQRKPLYSVMILALGYIFVSGLVMFTMEGQSFKTFFDALYWATTALTTVGYGDIYPKTILGKLVSMVSSIMGIAVVALPAGIITSGYMEELNSRSTEEDTQ